MRHTAGATEEDRMPSSQIPADDADDCPLPEGWNPAADRVGIIDVALTPDEARLLVRLLEDDSWNTAHDSLAAYDARDAVRRAALAKLVAVLETAR
jgi:hypothetical protein